MDAAVIPVGTPTPATIPERYVRVCSRHLIPLQERLVQTAHGRVDVLTCPGPAPRPLPGPGRPLGSHRVHEAPLDWEKADGSHRVGGWATYDTVRGVVYGGGTRERVIVQEGELDEVLRLMSETDNVPVSRMKGPRGPLACRTRYRTTASARGASVRAALRYF